MVTLPFWLSFLTSPAPKYIRAFLNFGKWHRLFDSKPNTYLDFYLSQLQGALWKKGFEDEFGKCCILYPS